MNLNEITRSFFFIGIVFNVIPVFLMAQMDTTFYRDNYKYVQSSISKNKIKETVFYSNGVVKSIGIKRLDVMKIGEVGKFANNGEWGPWTYYFENGKKSEEGKYKATLTKGKSGFIRISEKKGKWNIWNDKGKLQRVEKYKRGHLRKLIEWTDVGEKKTFRYKVPMRLFGRQLFSKRIFPIQ